MISTVSSFHRDIKKEREEKARQARPVSQKKEAMSAYTKPVKEQNEPNGNSASVLFPLATISGSPCVVPLCHNENEHHMSVQALRSAQPQSIFEPMYASPPVFICYNLSPAATRQL